MIVTRTPLRVSFFGGGSDIPKFYNEHDGITVSTTINSYIYLAIHRCTAPHLKVIYSDLELTEDIEQVKHNRVREVLKHYGITSNIEVCSFSDVTVKGTGLGSSSTFTCGLIKGIHKLVNPSSDIAYEQLAELASHIEINKCNEPIGKQDQYAAAHGGLNAFYYSSSGVMCRKLKIDPLVINQLNDNLYMFNTGQTRQASSILKQQVDNLSNDTTVEMTKSMCELAKQSIKLLHSGKIDEFGELLDQGWQIKKHLANGVSNRDIDTMYDIALEAGALGGKILGAGGGGYLLVYCPDKNKQTLLSAMSSYERLPFRFTNYGSQIVSNI